ncbi:MAG TPA: hypothetical protein VFL59_14530 [Candidatus Nanopelagicales bacterium]|nr:hypothetical protein [Candidatus Nanopelagicales bacterium]
MAVDEWRSAAVAGTRSGWRSALTVIVVVGAALVVVMLIARHFGVDLRLVATDPDDIAGAPAYYGGMGLFGFAVWGAGAGAAAVGGVAARGAADPYRCSRMLIQASLITAWLVIDDMYQLHENALPNLGIPQKLVIVVYVVVVAAWAWGNRAAIRSTEFPILVAALAFLALSVAFDQEVLGIVRGPFFEDTPKIIGICLWSLWLARSSIRLVRSQRVSAVSPVTAGA